MNWKFWKKDDTSTEEKETKPKSKLREWWDAILFAVIAATLIRWLIMEAYTIPTASMENSLLVGDFLFVSKFHYGTRTTSTPLQVPLTHQKIWFTEIPSYSDAIQLPQYRLPGISRVKNNDVVVFNVPPDALNDRKYPVDLKTNYIKRCVAIAGDVFEIRNQQIYINGVASENPEEMQFGYRVISSSPIHARNFDKYGIGQEDYIGPSRTTTNNFVYTIHLTDEKAEEIRRDNPPYILSLEKEVDPAGGATVMPYGEYYKSYGLPRNPNMQWTQDNFGPLWIPKAGETIAINDSTLALYGHTIVEYDLNDDARINDGKLLIDGAEVSSYTFKQDYYFMVGDSRHNSLDSRYWGFVPANHIVGKALFIWLSLDPNKGIFSKVRWSRFFNGID